MTAWLRDRRGLLSVLAGLVVLGALACLGAGPAPSQGAPRHLNTETSVTAPAAGAVGDADCNGGVDSVDGLRVLRHVAGLQPDAACINAGNVKCDDGIDAVDALFILRHVAALTVNLPASCPPIGSGAVGPGVTLDGDVVSTISSERLLVTHTTGDDMLAASSQWADYFSAIGAQSGSVLTSTAEAKASSTLDFRMTAMKAPGVDWGSMVARFVAAIQAHPNGPLVATQQTVGGKAVWQVTVTGLPGETSYYYANGDTLDLLSTQDSDLAGQAFEALPTSGSAQESAVPVPQADDPEPGESPLTVTPIHQIQLPVCVGEEYGRQHLELLALDFSYGMPVTASFTGDGRVGKTDPPVSLGSIGVLLYKATGFLWTSEELHLKAVAPAGGLGLRDYNFPVQHCLNGTWQDAQRVLKMDHEFTQITANIQSGTLCDEEGGVAFSGTLNPPDSQFSGSDLKVCNPDDCVQAGLEPVSTTVDYSAEIATDGNSISFSWKSADADQTFDNQGHLQACTPNGKFTDHSFSIDRLTFGPGVPY